MLAEPGLTNAFITGGPHDLNLYSLVDCPHSKAVCTLDVVAMEKLQHLGLPRLTKIKTY